MAAPALPLRTCLVVCLAWLPVFTASGQERPTTTQSAQTPAREDPGRAARKARLLAEFRALLDSSVAERDASATTALPANSPPPSPQETRGATATKPAASFTGNPAALWPKNPQLDYSGFACEYFTQPPKSDDRAASHADGTWVAYGERMYQCVDRRWRLEGPAAAYDGWQERQASVVEH